MKHRTSRAAPQHAGKALDPSASLQTARRPRGLRHMAEWASALALFASLPSVAQDNDTGDAAASERGIEEVLVTARKRTESVQDIPLSIATISSEDLERRNLVGMEDYLRQIPGVNQIDNGPTSNAIIIRGVTTSPEFENFGSGTTVAHYFDESPITGAAGMGQGGIDVRPVDIARIEVLRGPQGTAFGSASLGGAVRVIPMKPQLDRFGAKVAASYSNTSGYGSDNHMLQGVLNAPLSETFGVRVVGYKYEESGFYRNIAGEHQPSLDNAANYGLENYLFNQDDVGRTMTIGGRLHALWQPTENLDLNFTFVKQDIEQDGSPVATIGKYEQTRNPVAPQGRIRNTAMETNDTSMELFNVVLNYNFGWAALTSTVSKLEGGGHFTWAGYATPHSTTGPSNFESFSTETRLASQLEGAWQFLAGVYYEDVTDGFEQTWDWPGPEETNPYDTNPMLDTEEERKLDQRAVFGEVSYDITEKLTATLGGRFFKFEKNNMQLQEGGAYGVPLGGGTPRYLNTSDDGTSFKANLSYEPTDNTLVYASWAEGFRLGRPSSGLPSATCDTNSDGLLDGTSITIESTRTITSDFLESYEVGTKASLFDRRMVVEASVYQINWEGLPLRSFAASCGLSYVANVGAAESRGLEFQASYLLTEDFRVDFGGGYIDAELTEDAPGLNAPAGSRLPGSPKVTANLALQLDFNLGEHAAFWRADSFYAGEFYGSLLETEGSRAGDYIKVDTRAGVKFNNLSVELFVRNLTDDDAFTWRSLGAGTNPFYGYRIRPRTIGVELEYQF